MFENNLNMLALEYIEGQDEEVFRELYIGLKVILGNRVQKDCHRFKQSEDDVWSVYHDKIISVIVLNPDPNQKFIPRLMASIRYGLIDLFRERKRRWDFEIYEGPYDYYEDDAEDEEDNSYIDDAHVSVSNLVDLETTETEAVTNVQRERDQRQLISFLTDPAQVNDATTTAIVEAFPRHESIGALGKALGIHHEKVKRKLRRLAKCHDADRFGDYCDYLVG